MTDRDWCRRLSDALSLACVAPSVALVDEVRALLAAPPAEMLTSEWVALRARARDWLARCDAALPRFAGGCELRAAEAALPARVPHWAAGEAAKEAAAARRFQELAEGGRA